MHIKTLLTFSQETLVNNDSLGHQVKCNAVLNSIFYLDHWLHDIATSWPTQAPLWMVTVRSLAPARL